MNSSNTLPCTHTHKKMVYWHTHTKLLHPFDCFVQSKCIISCANWNETAQILIVSQLISPTSSVSRDNLYTAHSAVMNETTAMVETLDKWVMLSGWCGCLVGWLHIYGPHVSNYMYVCMLQCCIVLFRPYTLLYDISFWVIVTVAAIHSIWFIYFYRVSFFFSSLQMVREPCFCSPKSLVSHSASNNIIIIIM